MESTENLYSPLIEPPEFFRLIRKLCKFSQGRSHEELNIFLHDYIFTSLGKVFAEIYFKAESSSLSAPTKLMPLRHKKENQQSFCSYPSWGRSDARLFNCVPRDIPDGHACLSSFCHQGTFTVFSKDQEVPGFLENTGNLVHALFPIFLGKDLEAILYLGCCSLSSLPENYLLGVQSLADIIGTLLPRRHVVAPRHQSRQPDEYAEPLQQALFEISEQAHLAASEEELYSSLHGIVGRFIHARNFFIALRHERDSRQYIKFVYYFDEFDSYLQGMEFEIDPQEKFSMSGFLLHSGKPVLLRPELFDEFCRVNNIRPIGTKAHSLIGVPFYLEQLAGVVLVQSYYQHVYTKKDLDLLVYVARHIGDALSRKRAIDGLRETNEIFSLFLRHSPVHVYIKEVKEGKSTLLRASDNYPASLHKRTDDILGKSMEELFPPEFAATTTADDWQVISSGTPLQKEEDFEGRTYSTIKFPITQAGRSFLAGYSIDVTTQKMMEEALRQKEQRYRIIFEKSPLAVISFDTEGTIIDFNDKFIAMMGSSREKLLGFNTARQSSPKMRETIKKALSGEAATFEDAYTSITGGKTTFLRGLFNPVNPGHSPTEVIATIEDITELKKHEKEQQRIEKLESLGVLAGGIAHDFNNILTGILGNISFAQVFIDPSHKAGKPLAQAEQASRRAAELAQQLLTFARGGEPNKKMVSLRRLIEDSTALMLRGSNIKAILELEEPLYTILADEGQISQVLNNLIINATQAMPGGGTLTINGGNEVLSGNNTLNLPAGAYVRLQIRDEGCGISQDNLGRIFDPYFSTKISGTGLGLATVYSIILRHKGQISVVSEIDKGTVFSIYLPSTGASSEDVLSSPIHVAEVIGGGHILVMDDEAMIREVATEMLKHLGYQVTTCAEGAEAIELYQSSLCSGAPYLAVIMDLTIPGGLGGKETAERLLAISPTAHLIVSSGYSNDPIVANFRQYGFCGAITKPYNLGDFQAVLRGIPEPSLKKKDAGIRE